MTQSERGTLTGSAHPPEDPWLDAEEQTAWRQVLYGTQLLMERLSTVLEQDPEIDLTLAEYEILVRLSEGPTRRKRMSELAEEIVHSRSRLTHTVGRLEKRGLLTRQRCSDDGRGREAVLEPAGMALLEHAAPFHAASVRRYLLDLIGREDLLTLGRIFGRTVEPPEGSCFPGADGAS